MVLPDGERILTICNVWPFWGSLTERVYCNACRRDKKNFL